MAHLEDIFNVLDDNLISYIPENIDEKNPHKYFAYYYEHFALSVYTVFMDQKLVTDSATLPLEVYIYDSLKKYEKEYGKVTDIKKKWILMHLLVLSKCSTVYELSMLNKIAEDMIRKVDELSLDTLVFYTNQLNMSFMSESGLALFPRPAEINRTELKELNSFTPFFNAVIRSIEPMANILKKRVKVREIKDLADYIDPDYLKYIKKHDILAEYFAGIIVLKRDIIMSEDDEEVDIKKLEMKREMLQDEIKKFIDSTCEIDESTKKLLQADIFDFVESFKI